MKLVRAFFMLTAIAFGQVLPSPTDQMLTTSGTIQTNLLSVGSGGSNGFNVYSNGICAGCVTMLAGSNSVNYACDTSGRCYSSNTSPVAARKNNPNPATLAMVKSSAKLLDGAALAPASYARLAKSVGLDPSVTSDEALITDAIAKLGLHVYKFSLVDDYLYNKAIATSKNTRWVWKPMRASDLKHFTEYGISQDAESVDQTGVIDYLQYSRKLPIEVLTTVHDFLAEMPEVNFLVSDYATVKPDPFLAVTTPRLMSTGKIWIIQVWDEPTFIENPVHISIGGETASVR